MAQVISIADDVYEDLTRMKGKDSYSVLLRGLVAEKSNKVKILSFFGKGGVEKGKVKELSSHWKKWSEKYV